MYVYIRNTNLTVKKKNVIIILDSRLNEQNPHRVQSEAERKHSIKKHHHVPFLSFALLHFTFG